jgi:predicted GIY-YIG superfamily endonuclease
MLPFGDTRVVELYRLFDDENRLLYVGISLSTAHRMAEHKDQCGWWPSVTAILVERHPNRSAALRAEKAAIELEKPLYNKTCGVASRSPEQLKYEADRRVRTGVWPGPKFEIG